MTPYDHPRLRELLAGILAAPEDDGPRLAYADALAELGDGDRAAQERAEFVRVGVELAGYESPQYPGLVVCEGKGPPAPAGSRKRCRCRPCVLRRRERELWFAPLVLRELPDASVVEVCLSIDPDEVLTRGGIQGLVRRGFVESLAMPASALPHLDAVRACQPVTKVTLTGPPEIDYVDSDLLVPYLVGLAWSADRTAEELPIAEGDYVALGLLRLRFPGISWTLPVT